MGTRCEGGVADKERQEQQKYLSRHREPRRDVGTSRIIRERATLALPKEDKLATVEKPLYFFSTSHAVIGRDAPNQMVCGDFGEIAGDCHETRNAGPGVSISIM